MRDMTDEAQESRTMSLGAKVTPREKLAVEWVAGMKGTDVSNLIRVMVVEPLMEEHARLTGRSSEQSAA